MLIKTFQKRIKKNEGTSINLAFKILFSFLGSVAGTKQYSTSLKTF